MLRAKRGTLAVFVDIIEIEIAGGAPLRVLGQICTLSTSTSCSLRPVPRLFPGLPLRPARTCTTYICLLSFIVLFSFLSSRILHDPSPDHLPLRYLRPRVPLPARLFTISTDLYNLHPRFPHAEVGIPIGSSSPLASPCSAHLPADMDSWRVAVLGDGGVGKTALAVQVRRLSSCARAKLTEGLVYAHLLRR